MTQDMTDIQKELAEKWGPRTKEVLHQLNQLIAETLAQRDLLAFGFVAESTAKLMTYAVEMAKSIQDKCGESFGEVLH